MSKVGGVEDKRFLSPLGTVKRLEYVGFFFLLAFRAQQVELEGRGSFLLCVCVCGVRALYDVRFSN